MDRDIGTLYVLANRDASLAKVGMTRNGTPETRAADYERQHGIQWTRVYWSALTENVQAVEARCHGALAPYRFALSPPGATEIYHLIPEKAVRVAERYVIAPVGTPAFSSPTPDVFSHGLQLTRNPLWPLCREALMAAASVGLYRTFSGPSRNVVRSVALRALSRWLRRI
jgi:Meiotically up-regulated gene 113